MSPPDGWGRLTRLVARRERLPLLAWTGLLSATTIGTAAKYKQLFNTPQAVASLADELGRNRVFTAFGGQLTRSSLPGLALFKMGDTAYTMVALMALLMVTRHTRAEEESGRLELVAASVDRRAPLAAAVTVTSAACASIGLLSALGMMSLGFPAAGCVAFGCALAVNGLVFTGISAVAAQLAQTSRGANGLAGLALGISYGARFASDGTGTAWLGWMTPQGWCHRVQPFGDERWWVLVLPATLYVALLIVAFGSVGRRDMGTGLLPARPGPASAPQLSSAWALAWRLQRGLLAGWMVAAASGGLVVGAMVSAIPEITSRGGLAIQALFQRFSHGGGALTADVFLWLLILTLAYTAGLYPILVVLRLREEERSGRAEALLSTGVSRARWAGSHLVVALTGSFLIMLCGGLGVGVAHGLRSADLSGQLPRVVLACLVQVPAVWTLGGVAMLAVGALPRAATAVAWSAWMLVNMSGEVLGPILGIDYGVANQIAPFHHVPKLLTGEALRWSPLLALALVSGALMTAGIAMLRRRDVGT